MLCIYTIQIHTHAIHRNRLPCFVLNLLWLYIFHFGQENLHGAFIFSPGRHRAIIKSVVYRTYTQPHAIIYVTYACKCLKLFWTHVVKLCITDCMRPILFVLFCLNSNLIFFATKTMRIFPCVICEIWYTYTHKNEDD